MLHDLGAQNSLINQYVAELRDISVQSDRLRFRKNLFRIGQIIGYEISKTLRYAKKQIQTPLSRHTVNALSELPVLATILRAGLGLHEGLLDFFDGADSAFVSAYRKHAADGSFEIELEYVSCPALDGKIVIICDPMLATGQSISLTAKALEKWGRPAELHLVAAIAAQPGVDLVQKALPHAHIWTAALDAELDQRAYIVPGLGDAGDLCFGPKLQN